tara:strand:+ start:21492 stop:23495 length:2004 start_codon:yes stop_codon:yes gene_type:complete
MNAIHNVHSLGRPFTHLVIITLVIVLTTIFVNLVSWQSTQSVSDRTNQLVKESLPQLKIINRLENNVNKQILQLYTYYSTLDANYWENFLSLQEAFQYEASKLMIGNLIFNYQQALFTSNEKLHQNAILFHREMQKNSSRNWDVLRTHLASAQSDTNHLIAALDVASDITREEAVAASKATLSEVLQLKNIQAGFSFSVILVAGILIIMLRGRLLDQQELYKRAYFDNLTGLPNRKQAEDDWASENKSSKPDCFLLIKLDHYHLIASTFGHTLADHAVMQTMSRLITAIQSVSSETSLYQFSSATWLLSIKNDTQNELAKTIAENILATTSGKSLRLDESELSVTCSIGIANFPEHGESIGELLRNADSALYESHKSGRNTFTIFHSRIKDKIDKLLAMESNLRNALHNDEFELYFQPKLDTVNGSSFSAEALIRWRKNGKILLPGEFIPVAERSNLIMDIGNWVIDEACYHIHRWRKNGYKSRKVAVNISPKHLLATDFVDTVLDALKRHQLPAHSLELEITEEAMADDPETIISRLQALQKIGVTISIDDFGTGYSSLSYIRALPVDTIKIDKSFISAMTNSSNDLAIVLMIIQLAKKLDLTVVAEGVETKRQQKILTRFKCDFLQGYLFSPPLDADKYEQYLLKSESDLQLQTYKPDQLALQTR